MPLQGVVGFECHDGGCEAVGWERAAWGGAVDAVVRELIDIGFGGEGGGEGVCCVDVFEEDETVVDGVAEGGDFGGEDGGAGGGVGGYVIGHGGDGIEIGVTRVGFLAVVRMGRRGRCGCRMGKSHTVSKRLSFNFSSKSFITPWLYVAAFIWTSNSTKPVCHW